MALHEGLGGHGGGEGVAQGVDTPRFLAQRDTVVPFFFLPLRLQRKRQEGWTEITCKVYFATAENYTEEKYYFGPGRA